MRVGTVVLIGRPNVGKSSLINALLKSRVVIVSPRPQATRNAVRCIYNDDRAQIVFTDTPGVNIPRDKLGSFLAAEASDALEFADAVCYLVEAGDRTLSPADLEALQYLSPVKKPVLLVVNKCDGDDPQKAIKLYSHEREFKQIILISAKKGSGVAALIDALLPFIPEGQPLYDPDILMDTTERFMASEIIREKVLSFIRDEVPHRVAVEIDEYKSPEEYPGRKKLYIRASLIVETTGHKGILIGGAGEMLKRIGRSARVDLEKVTGFPVYLELWVKVSPGWRQSDKVLRRLGYA